MALQVEVAVDLKLSSKSTHTTANQKSPRLEDAVFMFAFCLLLFSILPFPLSAPLLKTSIHCCFSHRGEKKLM